MIRFEIQATKDDLICVTAITPKQVRSQILYGVIFGPMCYLTFNMNETPAVLEPIKHSELIEWMTEYQTLPTRNMKQSTWDAIHVFLSQQITVNQEKKALCKVLLPKERIVKKMGL